MITLASVLLAALMAAGPALPTTQCIAHRGWHGNVEAQENTLEAIERAVTDGADGVEFDVHFTADGVGVVHHDHRAGPGCRRTSRMTWEALSQCAPQVPTLDAVLTRLAEAPGVIVVLELKDSVPQDDDGRDRFAQSLARLAGEYDRLWVISFSKAALASARPSLGAGGAEESARLLHLSLRRDDVSASELDGVDVNHRGVTSDLVDRVHAGGKQLGVWHGAERDLSEDRTRELIEMGVDFITTDTPRTCLELTSRAVALRSRSASGPTSG